MDIATCFCVGVATTWLIVFAWWIGETLHHNRLLRQWTAEQEQREAQLAAESEQQWEDRIAETARGLKL